MEVPREPLYARHAAAFLIIALSLAAIDGARAAGDAAAGRKKAQLCQACHGVDGLSKIPEAPSIAGDSEFYLIKQLKAFRSGQRTQEQMSIVAQQLTDEDIANLAAWYSSIQVTVKMPGQ